MGIDKCGESTIMLKKQDFYGPHRRGVLTSEESFSISKVGKTVIFCNKDAAGLNLKSNEWEVDAKIKGVMDQLQQAILAPGGIAALSNAPRHCLTNEEYERVKVAVNCLCRDKIERHFLGDDIGALIGRSVVKQGVIVLSKCITFGFDAKAPWPFCGYRQGTRAYLGHMFCDDAVVAFFFADQQTGMVSEAHRVAGNLAAFGAPPQFDPISPVWGRIRY